MGHRWLLSTYAIWSLLIQRPGGITVHFLHRVRTLFLGNSYSPECTSYFNSYCRSLLDWSHYRNQQAVSALTLASLRIDEVPRGWSFPHRLNSPLRTLGNHFIRLRGWCLLRLGKPFSTPVGNPFNRPDKRAQVAEESAQSCLLGLARSVVTTIPKVAPKPDYDEAIVSVLDLEPQPHLLITLDPH